MKPVSRKSGKAGARGHATTGDRRKMYRIRVPLKIIGMMKNNNEPFRLTTENINMYGIKFVSKAKLREADLVDMKFFLSPPLPTISIKGRVVWCRKLVAYGEHPINIGFEGGIEFTAGNTGEMKYLEKFINQHFICKFESHNFGHY